MISFIIFIAALTAMSALLILRHIELKRGQTLFASKVRESCDVHIRHIEAHCGHKCTRENALHTAKHAYNTLAHKFAKVTASIAKKIEWRARSVAHKSAKAKQDGVEVRENEYLRDVQGHKDSLNIEKVAEETKI